MFKKKNQPYYTNRHSCFLLQYHLVLFTKYRKPVLTGPVKNYVYKLIEDICTERGYNILELNGEADHLHLLFEATPGMAPTEFVNVLKTKTARFARRDYPTEVGRFYWKPYFWSSSYFVATVSEQSLSLVQKYIKNQ
ncbi:putative transposase [Lachnospiraceae bacterium PM6-15]|uniref:IS200/IS605 family transposase n=1 Tax=Ohessyouella blattaphilus TaxID=2949333 RepID=A0ABT1EL08_9FIRM|nr:IS200/IS605 family transposase [Ohessyouella blattaphilus]MCP1111382.1 IS200/IS605 family transposase [Ohessyouella blattaphilus]MCR8564776.1 IS200/IS605 family transposase [Ohessyouella blattaphilus]